MSNYYSLPSIPDAGLLNRYLETLGIIVPIARTNLVLNPSLESGTTNWAGLNSGSIFQVRTFQYHGAASLQIIPGASAGDGAVYGGTTALSTVSGTTYALSMKLRGSLGKEYELSVRTTGNAVVASRRFTGTGRWMWIWLVYQETATTSRRIAITAEHAGGVAFYIDGVQFEACEAGNIWPTTYIDGDQRGLVPKQYPPAYGWNGTPHASTSYRIGQTRAGGRVVLLKNLGFLLTAIIGLGLAPPQHQALTFAQLDGGQYQDTIKPPRTFSLTGRVVGGTPNEADVALAQIGDLLDRDRIAQRQPLVLTMQAQECGVNCGELVTIPALYSGGLEGQISELPTQQAPITFTQYLPYVVAHDQGAELSVRLSVANANGIVRRTTGGIWAALGTGVSGAGAVVYALARGLDGTIYVGGDFTDAGGSGADYLAAYNPTTGTWSAVGGATAINGIVRALAVGADGRIYVGGNFTNAGGDANADRVAVWNPTLGTWAALGTGTAGQVSALAFAPTGILYAGGAFTSIGGSTADYVAQWDGSAWSNLASDTALNSVVETLVWGNGVLYVGGNFTNAGGVAAADYIATWSGSAWGALGTGMGADVLAIAIGLNGYVYAGGTFTTAGGVAALRIAVWNGQQWAPVGAGVDSAVRALFVAGDGTIYVGGAFSVISGVSFGSGLARWNGSTWVRPDFLFPATAIIYAILAAPDGTIYVGNDQSGTGFSAAATTVTNNGNVDISPTLTLFANTASTVGIRQITNVTTGQTIYLNLIMNPGEVATLNLDPTNISFVSTFQGNIIGTILPGSQQAFFTLQPGANSITVFATDPNAIATIRWPLAYTSLNKALYQAVTP